MVVRFIRPWRRFNAGHVTSAIPDGVANLLIRRNICMEVEEAETAEVKPQVEQAVKRKRGRPRKVNRAYY